MKKYLSFLLFGVLAFIAAAVTSCEDNPVEATEYSITVSIGEGGNVVTEVEGSAASKAMQGESVTLTATPDEGYAFSRWIVESGDVEVSGNPATFTMPAGDVTVKAEFTIDDHTVYTITITDDGHGTAEATVEGEPVEGAKMGTEVTLTATSTDENYKFNRWTVESGDIQISGNPATFTMPNENVSVKAEFTKKDPFINSVIITSGGHGTAEATVDGNKVTDVRVDTEVTITATPDEEYVFNRWVVKSGGVILSSYTEPEAIFTMPDEDVTIEATFKPFNVITAIEDNYFKNYCLNYLDPNMDGVITMAEARSIEKIAPSGSATIPMKSMVGIEYFTEVKILNCHFAALTELDLSKNTKLEEVTCFHNELTKIDVSNCPNLKMLISEANSLEKLDLSKNEALEMLRCHDNRLSVLDVSAMNNPTGYTLYCGNQKTADGSALQRLTLTLDDTQKARWYSSLASQDTNANVDVEGEDDFDVLTAITDVRFRSFCGQFDTNLNGKLSKAEAESVTEINAYNMGIESLAGVEYFTNITTLGCGGNALKVIDVSDNKSLEYLLCQGNQLTKLNVSDNTALVTLLCQQNQLDEVIISGCTELREIIAFSNRMTSLDIRGINSSDSYNIYCGNQTSNGTDLQILTLYMRDEQKPLWNEKYRNNTNNVNVILEGELTPVENVFDVIQNATLKSMCGRYDTNGNGKLSMIEAAAVTELSLRAGMGINTLAGIEYFINLSILICNGNALTKLDVSKNSKLQTLNCQENQLNELTISGCTMLKDVVAFRNRLTTLDASDMSSPESYNLLCGQQKAADGYTEQTLTLTLSENHKSYWYSNLSVSPNNTNVILAGE